MLDTRYNMSMTTILVVDDSEAIRRALRRRLSDGGAVEVLEASDGEAAMQILLQRYVGGQTPPDLLITDMDMKPGMSGDKLIGEMRDAPALAGVPIILCSGEPDVHKIGARLGVVSFQKGGDVADLMGLVRAALGPKPVVG